MNIKEWKIYQVIMDEQNIGWIKSLIIIVLGVSIISASTVNIVARFASPTFPEKKVTYIIYAYERADGPGGVASMHLPFEIKTTYDVQNAITIIKFSEKFQEVYLLSWQEVTDVRKATH
jgi:hypothetical protein